MPRRHLDVAIAIGEAMRAIRHGYADVMLAGGSEALLTLGTIKSWEALRAMADGARLATKALW